MKVNLISIAFAILFLLLIPSLLAYKITKDRPNSEGQLYSVIGKNKDCSVYADKTLEINVSENVLIKDIFIEACGNTNAFANTFDSQGDPYMEYKDGSFVCPFEEGCLLEVYCCPYSECTENKVCKDNKGIFSKCKTVQCEEWKNDGYKCDVGELEEKIPYQYPEISYCTESSIKPIYIFLGVLLIVILIVVYVLKRK